MRKWSWVACGLVVGLVMGSAPPAPAEDIRVSGRNGRPGSPSLVPGSPGWNGGPGSDAQAVAQANDPSNQASARGGRGGDGGRGGPPTSGGMPGGAGGNGGQGGDAVATATTIQPTDATATVTAAGGSGGRGGTGGIGGADGSGGGGGNASATADARSTNGGNIQLSVTAGGGWGGDSGSGAGGDGGDAILRDPVQFSTSGDVAIDLTASGGDGGSSFATGNTGTGGDGIITSNVSHLGGGDLSLSASAVGGRSQPGLGGNVSMSIRAIGQADVTVDASARTNSGGTAAMHSIFGQSLGGGNVSVSASQTHFGVGGVGPNSVLTNTVAGSTAGTLTLMQRATMGFGGDAVSSLHATNPGGGALVATSEADARYRGFQIGGDAHASITADETSGSDVTLTAISKGGVGTSGGTATLGPVYGRSQGGNVSITGEAWGGYTGLAGSSGATVDLVDAIDADTSGRIDLHQLAYGGRGSVIGGASDGNGGSATSSLRRTKSAQDLRLTTVAYGGIGRGDGANADAIAEAINLSGSAWADARANAGASRGSDALSGGSGRGGDAHSKGLASAASGTADASATARGGSGGSWSAASPIPGAGEGGNASAAADANGPGAVSSFAHARGGDGASVTLPDGTRLTAGHGDASAIATGSASGAEDAVVTAHAESGANSLGVGGAVFASAFGSSAGGDALVTAREVVAGQSSSAMEDQVSGSAAGHLSLVQESLSVRGGNASSILNAENPGGGALSVSTIAESGASSPLGGFFGNAHASATGTDFTGHDLHVRAEATASSPRDPQTGGLATLGRIFGESTRGGDVWVTGILTQGASKTAGSNSTVTLDNRVDGKTTGALTLEQSVSLYTLEVHDPTSRSESHLAKTVESDSLRLLARASGGASEASSAATNLTGDAHASAEADASDGFDAIARARAEAARDGSSITVGVSPHPVFPTFPAFNRAGARGGIGESYLGSRSGHATSSSEGVHHGDGTVDVRDFAYGGRGLGVDGGDARSSAVAVGGGDSLVEALSDATAGGGSYGGLSGTATANATARGLGSVGAHAIVRGGRGETFGSGIARAVATGSTGEVSATAFGAFSMRAASTVFGNAEAEAYLTESDLVVAKAVDAYAVSLVNAGHQELAPFLQAHSRSDAAVADMQEVLDLGRFGSHHNQDGAITFSGHIASERQPESPFPIPRPPRPEGSYVLALLGLSVVEQGFDQLRFQVQVDSASVIDVTFTDALGAMAWFDDKVLSFGSASGLLPDLDVLLDVTSSDTSFGMELEFVLGTVPEPAVLVLLALAVGLHAMTRRRRC